MGAAFLSVNLVVVTLFYQKAESLSFFYLRNLLYLILLYQKDQTAGHKNQVQVHRIFGCKTN